MTEEHVQEEITKKKPSFLTTFLSDKLSAEDVDESAKDALPTIPKILYEIVASLSLVFLGNDTLQKLYLKNMSLFNYMIVCGIGVSINQVVIHLLFNFLGLTVANFVAIFVAFLWNWTFTVGPYGVIMGFSKDNKEVKTQND